MSKLTDMAIAQVKAMAESELELMAAEGKDLGPSPQQIEDMAGGYKVIEGSREPKYLELTLNSWRVRGWKLVSLYEGFGVNQLIIYKDPS